MLNLNELKSGFHYFVMGWHFITQKVCVGLLLCQLCLIPFCFVVYFGFFISQISSAIDWMMNFIPDWLSFLSVILLTLSILTILLLFYFTFTTFSGFIAAPFNGLLAEKVKKNADGGKY